MLSAAGELSYVSVLRRLFSCEKLFQAADRHRLKESGYDEVVVQVTPGWESMIDDWAHVFEIV